MLSLRVLRDAISRLSLRKKLTILASVGVVLPMLVLSYLQYRSLADLQNKTKGAFKDNLRQGFTNLQRQMRAYLFYPLKDSTNTGDGDVHSDTFDPRTLDPPVAPQGFEDELMGLWFRADPYLCAVARNGCHCLC